MEKKLAAIRNKIDSIDKKLIDLLALRLTLACQIGTIKEKYNFPVEDPKREKDVLSKIHGVDLEYRQAVRKIFEQIIRECSSAQQKHKESR